MDGWGEPTYLHGLQIGKSMYGVHDVVIVLLCSVILFRRHFVRE